MDGNDAITLRDAQLALKAALGIVDLEGDAAVAADVNCDFKITLSDAQLILKKALGIIP